MKGIVPKQLYIQYSDISYDEYARYCMGGELSKESCKMDFDTAKMIVKCASSYGFGAITFMANEPYIYIDEILELINIAAESGIEHLKPVRMVMFL